MSALGGGTLMLSGSASAEPAGPSREDTRKLRVGQTVWWTFRSFNWTHTTIVRWVNVTNFEARTVT